MALERGNEGACMLRVLREVGWGNASSSLHFRERESERSGSEKERKEKKSGGNGETTLVEHHNFWAIEQGFQRDAMSGDQDGAAPAATSTSSPDASDIVAERASNYSLTVSNGPRGHLARIRCVAFFPVSPEVIYSVLTNPDNSGVFRDVADCHSRKLLSEERASPTDESRRNSLLRVVEVDQLGRVRLGGPGPLGREITFRTRLRVTEDARGAPARMTTRFELLQSDVLSTFDGTWTLEPRREGGEEGEEGEGASGGRIATAATLEQDVTPRGIPRWLKFVPLASGAIKRACAGAVRRMVEDLAAVADAVFIEKKSLESVLEECRRRAEGKRKEGKEEEAREEEAREEEAREEGERVEGEREKAVEVSAG